MLLIGSIATLPLKNLALHVVLCCGYSQPFIYMFWSWSSTNQAHPLARWAPSGDLDIFCLTVLQQSFLAGSYSNIRQYATR